MLFLSLMMSELVTVCIHVNITRDMLFDRFWVQYRSLHQWSPLCFSNHMRLFLAKRSRLLPRSVPVCPLHHSTTKLGTIQTRHFLLPLSLRTTLQHKFRNTTNSVPCLPNYVWNNGWHICDVAILLWRVYIAWYLARYLILLCIWRRCTIRLSCGTLLMLDFSSY
jgi:hypothetical protein